MLIVEDDAHMCFGYDVFLKANNYDTFFASDSQGALNELSKHLPDLIILDIGLPVGGGFIVLERLRRNPHLAPVPVIVVSGRDPRPNKKYALRAGAKAFLQKPWDKHELLAIMSVLLGSELSATTN